MNTPQRIREATPDDWPRIWPFFEATVREGETYAYPADLTSEQARGLWMERPPVTTTTAEAFTAAQVRELKGSAPVQVDDDLSPLGDGTSEPAPAPDTVDDDLSPMGSIH